MLTIRSHTGLSPISKSKTVDAVKHFIKHEQDAIRLLQQDFTRDRLIEQARKGEPPADLDVVTGHVQGRHREGALINVLAFCLVALGSFGVMALLHWR